MANIVPRSIFYYLTLFPTFHCLTQNDCVKLDHVSNLNMIWYRMWPTICSQNQMLMMHNWWANYKKYLLLFWRRSVAYTWWLNVTVIHHNWWRFLFCFGTGCLSSVHIVCTETISQLTIQSQFVKQSHLYTNYSKNFLKKSNYYTF